jgi:hypothetical protein
MMDALSLIALRHGLQNSFGKSFLLPDCEL